MNNMELETDIEALDMEMGDVTIHYCPVIPNPEGEPTAELKTADIEGTIYEIVDEEARTELENKVDKIEGKGLSENDYTDEDKAIVDGVPEALNGKVDKDGDKVLSDNNYSDEDKAIVDGVTSALNDKADKSDTYTKSEVDSALDNKVDKVEGKDLSENDFTDTLKDKLDGIEEEANKTVVDNALDGTSANPVENRVVKSALDEKLNADETAVNSNGLVIATPVTDNAPYIYRQTPVKESFKALMKKIVGASVVWNQLWNETKIRTNTSNGLSYSANSDHSLTINGTLSSSWSNIYTDASLYIELKPSNVYMLLCDTTNLPNGNFMVRCQTSSGSNSGGVSANRVVKTNANVAKGVFRIEATSQTEFDNIKIGKPIFIDLTAMFGTTIADYVYTLETSQSGSGIAWLQSYGFFTKDYYAYKQNTLASGCVSAKKIYGKNLLPKATSNEHRGVIYTVNADGSVSVSGTASGGTSLLDIGRDNLTLKPGTYYASITSSNATVTIFTITDGVASVLRNGVGSFTLTKTTSVFLRLSFANGTTASGTAYPQIEIGSTATSYEPYTETTYPISPITLRGLFKLSTDKLTVDGDEYNADGSKTSYFNEVDMGSLNWQSYSTNLFYVDITDKVNASSSNAIDNILCEPYITKEGNTIVNDNTSVGIGGSTSNGRVFLRDSNYSTASALISALSGKKMIYKTNAPSTEQTTPFTETEIVGSTEEFIDYEVAQGNRDVAIPVGTETDYYQEMKLPSLPTTSGNHNLIYNVATGFGWS